MKTAISLPDDLFETADIYAERSQLSRSELYVLALREYLARHDTERVTAQLDWVCAEVDSHLEPEFAGAARRLLEKEKW